MRRFHAIVMGSIVAGAGCLPDYETGYPRWGEGRGEETSPSSEPSSSSGGLPTMPRIPPSFGPTVTQSEAPPPISGGTLAVHAGASLAVAADPDRGCVQAVDVAARRVIGTLDVGRTARPERIAIESPTRAHVVLRGTGEVVSIEMPAMTIAARRAVCPEPRGIAYDARLSAIHVACATGELVTLPAAGGAATRTLLLRDDLRDVVVTAKGLRVSTFREAGVFRLVDTGADGPHLERLSNGAAGAPGVAWRMIAAPASDETNEDDVIATAQRPGGVPTTAPEYYRTDYGCGGDGPIPVVLRSGGATALPFAVLPVDIATNGRYLAVVAAGNAHTPAAMQLVLARLDLFDGNGCLPGGMTSVPGQPTSVAFLGADKLVVLSREPAALFVMDVAGRIPLAPIVLSTESGNVGEWSYAAGGANNACAVRKNGSLACWGAMGGMPTTAASQTPVPVGAAADWKTVKPGYLGACATKTNDSLHCWAAGAAPAPTNLTVSAYDVGYWHQCAIAAGSLYCWGDGIFGKLGNGSNAALAVPTKVGADTWKAVATSFDSTCGLKADGSLWCFGFGYTGFEKQGTATAWTALDVAVQDRVFYGLQGSALHTWDWTKVPAAAGAENDWTSLGVGVFHVCGIRANGTLWCKGDNTYGQLGDGTNAPQSSFVQIGAATDWTSVTAGAYSTCGLRGAGDLYCWGSNDYGEAGDGTAWRSDLTVVP